MHILIVSQYYWPENFRINDLAIGMIERGHTVTVLTGRPNYPKGDYYQGYGLFSKLREQYKNVDIIRVPIISRGRGVVYINCERLAKIDRFQPPGNSG